VSVPMSADVVRGFGRTPQEVCATVRALIDVGVVGVNIEDGIVPGTTKLTDASVSSANISALRSLASETGVRLFINARTDTYFLPDADPIARYDETVRRARLYAEAGADGIFVPGLDDIAEIERMVHDVPRPLNVYAGYEGVAQIPALARAGAKRVSLGCGPFQALLALARRIATEALGDGTYAAMTASMLSNREVNALFSTVRGVG
jgi:2-methylisocitrate lyase-like PEP mutase family enzyme